MQQNFASSKIGYTSQAQKRLLKMFRSRFSHPTEHQ